MLCNIYKSLRKNDTYIFLPKGKEVTEVLPDVLKVVMGDTEFVMELEITPDRKLAREPAEVVLSNIKTQGFHLQLPPADPTEQL